MKSRLVRCCAALVVCLGGGLLLAQPNTGQVTGTVFGGPSKAVVAGATITVRELGTKLTRTVQASAAGKYSILSLHAGSYELAAVAERFETFKQNLFIAAGSKAIADVHLDVARTGPRKKPVEK